MYLIGGCGLSFNRLSVDFSMSILDYIWNLFILETLLADYVKGHGTLSGNSYK